jgi:ABC-type phosphate transport system auxiliary subunit
MPCCFTLVHRDCLKHEKNLKFHDFINDKGQRIARIKCPKCVIVRTYSEHDEDFGFLTECSCYDNHLQTDGLTNYMKARLVDNEHLYQKDAKLLNEEFDNINKALFHN